MHYKYFQTNYGQRFYQKAVNLLPVIKKAYDDVLAKYDVLVMPTLPTKPPKLPTEDECKSVKGKLITLSIA